MNRPSPRTASTPPSARPSHGQSSSGGRGSRRRREAWIAAGALIAGIVLLPFLIYLAGQLTLGNYESGGLGTFLKDFYLGLLTASPAAWCAALGPYAFLGFLRLVMYVSRRYLRPAQD